MASLVLLNGPPGIGKTTIADVYAADHPLTLVLDIDAVRCSMGQWETHEASKSLARAIAVAMTRVHLEGGHDVIVPQLVARLGFIEALESVAKTAGAAFHEVLLTATVDDTLQRFRARRAVMAASKTAHPQQSVDHDAASIAAVEAELATVARSRPNTLVIRTKEGAVREACRELVSLLSPA